MAEIKRQEVSPGATEDYGDSFYGNLYNTMVSFFGLNEQRLTWMRYAGFLVLQGFIINTIARGSLQPVMLLVLSLLGIICSTAWHILNFAGWLNQNVWFTKAAGLKFTKLTIPLPTEWWEKERALRPTGRIYGIAQSVPFALLLVYAAGVFEALTEMGVRWELACITSVGLVVVAWLIFLAVERWEYYDRSRKEDDRPIS